MTEKRTDAADPLDRALRQAVATYTDDAPPAPDVNEVLRQRAERRSGSSGDGRATSWLRPALLGAAALVLVAGGAWAVINASGGQGQTIVPADPTETTVAPPPEPDAETTTTTIDDARPEPPVDAFTGEDPLPESAPDTVWVVQAETFDLVEIDTRTGEVLTNLGGWGTSLGDPEEESLLQALQWVDVAPDGTLFLDDCCEPAFGNLYRLAPGQRFEQTESLWATGIRPVVSSSGERVAFMAFGGEAIHVSTADGALVAEVTSQSDGFVSFKPLAWIDDNTLAVARTEDDLEELIVYELDGDRLVEREAAGDGAARSGNIIDGATRADGMLLIAVARDTTGETPDDVWAEVIDPSSGDLVAEFPLPGPLFNVDYDTSGRFLLAPGGDGVLRWYGGGQSGVITTGVVSATWN